MEPMIDNTHPVLTVQRPCELADIARSTNYRHSTELSQPNGENDALRTEIRQICLTMHRYGYRRVTEELHRRGFRANHKPVLALMGKDNLLCPRTKRWICTTDSQHGFGVYPNLLKDVEPTRPDQVWVADITNIRLRRKFVYLAVVLDAFGRHFINTKRCLSRSIAVLRKPV